MRDGFDELYRDHRAALTRYARRQVGDGAEDIVAATYELAYTRLRAGHPHPLGWLFRTARNLIAAERGRQERERVAGRDAAVLAAPQDEVSDIELIRLLIAQLPPRDREVLQLTYWDRLSAAEVAVVLGCTTTAVWKRISRAKSQLREAWAGLDIEDGNEKEDADACANDHR